MATHQHTTLLVGRDFLESPGANSSFLKRRSQCRVASTVREVCELTRSPRFDLILTSHHLLDGTDTGAAKIFRRVPLRSVMISAACLRRVSTHSN